ncbi:DUF378 domain-containing protein [Sporosarcina sp. 6E9]|uniref:DUF378 domain-containing protein n=1 Tax=Sporosarcina sp. 6E9 TaxID=2819235 RepID=UPI001AC5780B|nr:DUF378 domain-containing protein [Sporosarcina sp. 6E9]MBO1909905.1 DUF378 domain-containing protein [Microvirga sp. 3-52]
MGTIQRIALALVIIGALNWGLAGLFRFDVVGELAGGSAEPIARLIYIIIGVAGLLNLGLLFEEWRGDRDVVKVHAASPEEI